MANNTINQLETKIERDKPKIVFADAVATTKTSILVGELAKIIKQNGINIGQRRLFEWLRQNGFLIKRKGVDYNMPTQYSMERELFEIKETSITHSDGHTSISKTPKVTGKGQQYFVNKFLGENKHLNRRNEQCKLKTKKSFITTMTKPVIDDPLIFNTTMATT
ncbi:phage antirepressor KilAC domain-containing protein [Staphylococcus aureus]|uniref:phage antirepressor KilAC domain-containing protein n=1 Tax=Staphylococcus aureus TaxID=1280 RepID=UPI0039A77AD4